MKKILPIIAALIMVGGAGFYGGIKYAESKNLTGNSANNFRNLQNLSPEERQQRFDQIGGGRTGNRLNGGFASGEIISKDDKGITIKLGDNRAASGQQQGSGSKIILYSGSTEIGKFITGTQDDISVGQSVMVNGTANPDGSITAQSIQVRPNPSNTISANN